MGRQVGSSVEVIERICLCWTGPAAQGDTAERRRPPTPEGQAPVVLETVLEEEIVEEGC